MRLQDVLWLSFKDLNEKRIRTALTVVMVLIGVAAIVALTSVTAGISKSISSSLSSLGPTSIMIVPSGTTSFTAADVARLSSLPNVSSVTPVITGSANIYAGNQNTSVTVIGTSSVGAGHIIGGGNLTLYQGTLYEDTITPAAVVGHAVAFPSSAGGAQAVSVGQTATLKIVGRNRESVTIPVIGVLNPVTSFIIPADTSVFVSIAAAQVLLHRNSYSLVLVTAENISSVNATASLISDIYGGGARVITTAQLLSTAASITGSLALLFGAIAGVSLIVAAIGIMNIMLIAVYERTHEIGILKSVGFKSNDVLMVFLVQALIIGMIGGVIGIGLGAGASYTLSSVLGGGGSTAQPTSTSAPSTRGGARGGGGGATFVGPGGSSSSTASGSFSFKPVFPIGTIIDAFLISVIVSVLAGIYPAWRASKLEPIDALREL